MYWNSAEPAQLPEGPNKHQTGAYFKTPSLQSAASSTVNAGAANIGQHTPSANSIDSMAPPPAASGGRRRSATPTNDDLTSGDERPPTVECHSSMAASNTIDQQLSSGSRFAAAAAATPTKPTAGNRRQKLKDVQRQTSGGGGHPSRAPGSGDTHPTPAGFRSRLSSISGALQHPKLAKRLFSNSNNNQEHHSNNTSTEVHHAHQQAPIQITTTSIDSPQHHQPASQLQSHDSTAAEPAFYSSVEHEPRQLMSTSSGRRLSQLFLPQLANNPLLLNRELEAAYAPNSDTLIPPHLLGLYGQPALAGGSPGVVGGGCGQHRASWADISLFGRLSNVRPSIDSAFHSTGGGAGGSQMRHSFDARKYTQTHSLPIQFFTLYSIVVVVVQSHSFFVLLHPLLCPLNPRA